MAPLNALAFEYAADKNSVARCVVVGARAITIHAFLARHWLRFNAVAYVPHLYASLFTKFVAESVAAILGKTICTRPRPSRKTTTLKSGYTHVRAYLSTRTGTLTDWKNSATKFNMTCELGTLAVAFRYAAVWRKKIATAYIATDNALRYAASCCIVATPNTVSLTPARNTNLGRAAALVAFICPWCPAATDIDMSLHGRLIHDYHFTILVTNRDLSLGIRDPTQPTCRNHSGSNALVHRLSPLVQ